MSDHGILMALTGPPVCGKSWTIKSAAKWAEVQNKKIAVACMPVAEADSYQGLEAAGHDIKIFGDPDWNPFFDQTQAEGYMKMMRWLRSLEKASDVAVIGIDTMTGASELAEHACLSLANVTTIDAQDFGRGYTGTTDNMKHLMTQLRRLAYRFGKHIICGFHVEFKELEGAGDAVEVKDMASGKDADNRSLTRLRWEKRILPQLAGTNRYQGKIMGEFSLILRNEIEQKGANIQGFLRVQPDETGLQRSRITLHAPPGEKRPEKVWMQAIPNDFSVLMSMIRPEETK